MNHRQRRGTILYLGDTVGERGREWFHRTDRPDGTYLVRSVSEIDDIDLLRDVTFAMDSRFRPLDCYERLTVRGETSMGWFHFSDREAICEGYYAGQGRISQRVVLDAWPGHFGAHPLVGDCLVPAAYDFNAGGKQRLTGFMSSPLVNGSTGPLLFAHGIWTEDLGQETVEVPAGTFEARHMRYLYGPNQQKTQDMWIAPGWNFVKVRNEELGTTYVLQTLEEF